MSRSVESGRLRRALWLEVVPQGAGMWRVIGGSAEHLVVTDAAGFSTCDCGDSAARPAYQCKHVIACQLRLPADVLAGLRELLPRTDRPRRRKSPSPSSAH